MILPIYFYQEKRIHAYLDNRYLNLHQHGDLSNNWIIWLNFVQAATNTKTSTKVILW